MAKVLVTGVGGCIGAWVCYRLLQMGHDVVGLDVSPRSHRLRLLGIEGAFPVVQVDVSDARGVREVVDRTAPDALIHLAALQVPFCKAEPMRCVAVNVGGMATMLEMAREYRLPLVYASSAAVYGPDQGRPLREEEGLTPQNLYGVFKRTNEEMARIYAQDYGITAIGVRPFIVYGPGRDQGMTSDITKALAHAAQGKSFHIHFGGLVALQYVGDVADIFIRLALHPRPGHAIYNLRGVVTTVEEAIRHIEQVTGTKGLVTCDPTPLPIAANLSDAALQRDYGPIAYTPLPEGFRRTLEVWRESAHV